MSYGSLATTGTGLSLAGVAFGQVWLLCAVLACVLLGAALVRTGFRRGKGPGDL
ncbi:hypothetical protein V1J52_02230 [Streptomyces sp. TRM 70351]|uniref:hypothetical protein n=1 Tax=Streptomyces sp. TRM 70351 TaxID=3116552 RepID=UPI002E7C176C|nr:hypothetical protein [Streptomyces sp. TRM 70351]MEE1927008.1 hypothetical protein [Streptomyces sp. TRM 70351]